jgi:predicted ATPase
MILTHVRITKFRSIDDSTEFKVDPNVTCLVGKNESGKTAVLQALLRLNPEQADLGFDVTKDYPRVHLNTYRKHHESAPDTVVVTQFELESDDIEDLEGEFGKGALRSPVIRISRNFKNELKIEPEVDEHAHVEHLVAQRVHLDPALSAALRKCCTLVELVQYLEANPDEAAPVKELLQQAKTTSVKPLRGRVAERLQAEFLPQFMYFGEYDIMRGSAELSQLQGAPKNADPQLRTLHALLELADIQPSELNPHTGKYEDHKARLESTANSITDEAFRYWSQNPDLEVELDVGSLGPNDAKYVAPPQGQPPPNWLMLRIKNRKHRVTVPFDDRSKGFVWFFSFLARFNQIAESNKRLILLLDEPGLSLHASAQADFLKFINERLADKGYQVIYTTHSPFMIEPDRLYRVRTVEDTKTGTAVSVDWLRTERQTYSPLLAALGIDVAQALMVGPNNLLVEGPSDLLYLQAMSEVVEKAKGAGLSRRWVTLPVHGADRLSFFSAFLKANRLTVAVLMDVDGKDEQRLKLLTKEGALQAQNVVKVGEFLVPARHRADIEDLFEVGEYLALVNGAVGNPVAVTAASLPEGDRITKRVKSVLDAEGRTWNHTEPAKYLATHPASVTFSQDTVARFAALFEKINKLLPQV